jgi:hypothetical protein
VPTARELLEQADALMRRNRSRDFEPDIPELTDEVAVATVSPPLHRPAPEPPSVAGSRVLHDDVPELTEMVGEAGELSIQLPPDDGGEISRWLEGDLGEVSVTGAAPDSVVVVPPATLGSPLDAVNDTANDTTEEEIQADATGIADGGVPDPDSFTEPELPQAVPASASELPQEVPASASELPQEVPASASIATYGNLEEPVSDLSEPPPESRTDVDEMPGEVSAEIAFEQEFPRMEASTAIGPGENEPLALSEPGIVATAPGGERIVGDAAQWASLAEDIRMQVLQRIDIYTDTGLAGELALRLQPIVDRASADLLTTINRQVGQLLRAYVAEAIEREIEKWREGNP